MIVSVGKDNCNDQTPKIYFKQKIMQCGLDQLNLPWEGVVYCNSWNFSIYIKDKL